MNTFYRNTVFIVGFLLFIPSVMGACSKGTENTTLNPIENTDPEQTDDPETDGKNTIKIMTYNIQHGAPYGEKDRIDLNGIAQVINHENPDLVALQEVDVYTQRANIDEARELGRLTGMNHYFFKAIDYQGGEYGIAVLSKYNMEDPRGYVLPMPVGGEQRVLAVITVQIAEDIKLDFGSTHLELNEENRIAQAHKINEISGESENPFIFAGDLNATPNEETIKVLEERFQSFCSMDCPPTYPSRSPSKAIDYIMMDGNAMNAFKIDHYRVVTGTEASDHLPVVQTISIKR